MAILLDGAKGTELRRRGCPVAPGIDSAVTLLAAPERVEALHRQYLLAGAQVLITHSFLLQPSRCAQANVAFDDIVEAAANVATQARDSATEDDPDYARVRILGSIGALHGPADAALRSDTADEHRRLAKALVEHGVDGLCFETFTRLDEIRTALAACHDIGVPVWLGIACNRDARLLGGEAFEGIAGILNDHPVAGLVINCTGLGESVRASRVMLSLFGGERDLLLGVIPHASRTAPDGSWEVSAYGSDAFADVLGGLMRSFPRIDMVGGCCGTAPAWTRALRLRAQASASRREEAFDRLDALVPRRPQR